MNDNIGIEMYKLIETLFPICRSITGNGFRESLKIIQKYLPEKKIKIYEIPSGTKVFDWNIPKEWNIRDAYIENSDGEKIIDFKKNNLHVLGYSEPLDITVNLDDLQKYLYSIPEQPDVIPYMTSYYERRSGFCITENQRKTLREDRYHLYIDSELEDGALTYGELIISGKSKKEVFFSTYLCHPSLANNELSGPSVMLYLIKYLLKKREREYSYRFIFIPETIGSIAYLSKNLDEMKKNIIAGYNITCVGDERTFSYIESRYGDTLADKVARNILKYHYPKYKKYSFLERGSDERQYNMPGIDLPICCIMRSKPGEFPEYHTSADNLKFVSPKGLQGSYDVYVKCIEAIEQNKYYKLACLCEPQLGKRGLYSTLSSKKNAKTNLNILNIIAYMDGKNDLLDISNRIDTPLDEIIPIVQELINCKLIYI